MKIKLDENLPATLVAQLSGLGHSADTVEHEGLKGRDDETVWARAQREGRLLITQDLDFSDIRRFRPGSHDGIVLVRLHVPGRTALARAVMALFRSEPGDALRQCFVVVTESKARIHRPRSQ